MKRIIKPRVAPFERSLSFKNKELAKLFHPTFNKEYNPNKLYPNSCIEIWWQCAINPYHIWKATINSMNNKEDKQFCSKCKKIFRTKSKFLINETQTLLENFDLSLNKNINYKMLDVTFSKKIFWQCRKNKKHIFHLSPKKMKRKKYKCQTCLLEKENLALKFPALAKEFHPIRNGIITAKLVLYNSNREYWWICKNMHEFPKTANERIHKGKIVECKMCILDKNNLAKKYPELAREFHPTKNGNIMSKDILYSSHKKYWWLCKNKHEFKKSPHMRYNNGGIRGCIKCRLAINSLAVKYPKMAEEFHPTKNGTVTTKDILYGSDKEYWWICKNNHEFKRSANHRMYKGKLIMCQVCRLNENNLAVKFPELAKEFLPSKNGGVNPNTILYSSNKKYIWVCKNNHEFERSPNSRFIQGKIRSCFQCGLDKKKKDKIDNKNKKRKLQKKIKIE